MRNTITKTVSMMLVTVMVLGIAVMPMRAEAAFEVSTTFGANPLTLTVDIINIVAKMGKEMLDGSNQGEPLPDTIATFSAYWEVYVTSNVILLTQQQMSELCQALKNKGVTVELYRRNDFPEKYMVVRLVSTVVNGIDLGKWDLQFGTFYTYNGMTVACKVDDSSASQNPSNKYTEDDGSEQEKVLMIDPATQELIEVTVTNAVKNAMQEYLATINVNNNTAYNPTTNTYNNYTDMSYNPTTKTYQVNFADNRSYTYNFYYDYTYITYIGSSAEYREAYKVYYELPDGRSSGDLTADELKGLSLQFDMVNYDKVASDTLTRILLPFDGDLENDSFYDVNVTTPTDSGYSFIESPEPFGGSLFVPITNGNHVNLFTAMMNQSLVKGDSYTVEGRFYLDGAFDSGSTYLTNRISFGLIYAGYFFPIFYVGYSSSTSTVLIAPWLRGPLDTFQTPISSGVWYSFSFVFDADLQSAYFYLNGQLCLDPDDGGVISNPLTYAVTLNNLVSLNQPEFTSSRSSVIANIALAGVGFFNGNSSCPIRVDNLRVVSHALYGAIDKIPVPQAPFDTNLVYVLPSVADLNDNTVAIMSQLPVSGYRVGGIRPTDPTLASGYVYMHIDGEYIDSVQQWNGAYWEEVTARLYTGIRWIPVTAFNVFTLEDMFDIIDPDADGSGDNVDDIYKYYLWWSGEWGSFQQWLQGTMQTLIEAIQASGGGGGGSDAPVVIVPGYNDQTTTSEITTENPDGSTTKTTIVSNAAGLVYSNSVTTYPTDANGNTKTITVYTDSSGVMYQTETIIDKDGNVTVTEPTKATGTLGSILKMITNGVMSIAGTVIEGFVTIVVDGVKFIIESAGDLFDGIADLFTGMFGAVTDFTDSVQDYVNPPGVEPAVDGDDDEQGDVDGGLTVNIFDAFFQVLPPWLVTGLTLCFTMMIVFPLMNKIHF